MKIAGLTGGIATGKSTVAGFLEQAGAVIVDADRIAHDLVRQGRPAWQAITDCFGTEILLPDGEIDRPRLGGIIFGNPEKRRLLDELVHPLVFEEMSRRVAEISAAQPDAVIIQDIPLLMESGRHRELFPVIVAYIPEQLQLERLMTRNALSRDDALARIHSQMPIEKKRILADIVIDNSGSLELTQKRTVAVYHQLKSFSRTAVATG